MNATGVTAGPAESNGKLLLGTWRDSLHVTCGLTACTPGSAPGPTLGNEYGKTLPTYCSYQRPAFAAPWKFAAALQTTSVWNVPAAGATYFQQLCFCSNRFHAQTAAVRRTTAEVERRGASWMHRRIDLSAAIGVQGVGNKRRR